MTSLPPAVKFRVDTGISKPTGRPAKICGMINAKVEISISTLGIRKKAIDHVNRAYIHEEKSRIE